MSLPIKSNILQSSLIVSGWPRGEDGNVYLANIPEEQKEYLQSAQLTKVYHPDGWELVVDDAVKDRLPLESATDTKIQALARKYILMPEGELKKSVFDYMHGKFSKKITKFAIQRAQVEKDSLISSVGHDWHDLHLEQFRLNRRVQKYETKHKIPFSRYPSQTIEFSDELGYLIRNKRSVSADLLHNSLTAIPFAGAAILSAVALFVAVKVAKVVLNLGYVAGSFVLKHMIKKFS